MYILASTKQNIKHKVDLGTRGGGAKDWTRKFTVLLLP